MQSNQDLTSTQISGSANRSEQFLLDRLFNFDFSNIETTGDRTSMIGRLEHLLNDWVLDIALIQQIQVVQDTLMSMQNLRVQDVRQRGNRDPNTFVVNDELGNQILQNIGVQIPDQNQAVGNMCSICLSDFSPETEVVRLPCQHMFCRPCLRTWILNKASCPNCKANFEHQEEHQEDEEEHQENEDEREEN